MKIDEIYAIPTDGNGWRVLPNGNNLHLGSDVISAIDLAEIGAWAKIPQTPLAVQGSCHLVMNNAPGIIQVGCKRFTFAEFQAASCEERTAYQVAEGYTPEQCAEYIRIVEFVIANGRPAEKEDESK